nr:nuclear transport factor 2 family protein [Streptomyces sp. S584]
MMWRMDLAFARRFAARWQDDWNSHDLDRILAHYHDDVTFSSPMIVRLTDDPAGTVHGKAALRAYWAQGLERIPDLRFEVMDVRASVDSLVIDYRDQIGGRVSEVLTFRDGLVWRASAPTATPRPTDRRPRATTGPAAPPGPPPACPLSLATARPGSAPRRRRPRVRCLREAGTSPTARRVPYRGCVR